MISIVAGLVSGLIAVIVMTIVMLLGKMMNVMPKGLDIGLMLGKKILGDSTPDDKAKKVGMIMHIIIGILLLSGMILQGVILSIYLWLLMMIVAMPMMNKGLFGTKIDKMVPPMTLLVHLVYGLVLGLSVRYIF